MQIFVWIFAPKILVYKRPKLSNQYIFFTFSGNKEITTRPNSQVFHGNSYSQPYRFGGRVGLFGHYLRSLKIILLLTSIKLDASRKKFNQKVVDQILRGICDLASGIEAVERKYVKKGQRLLFCGPDLLQLAAKCIDLQHAFDALLQGMIHNSVIASEGSSHGLILYSSLDGAKTLFSRKYHVTDAT